MPLRTWLVWSLMKVWAWQGTLAVCLLLSGRALTSRALGIRELPPLAEAAMALPVGAVAFSMGIFCAGYLGLLNPTFAVLWPLSLIAGGLWALRRDFHGILRLARGLWPRRPAAPMELVVMVLGILAVVLVYLQILSPESTTYDASWTHLTIAQDYAREGKIIPFYADWPKNLAHLGSVINTWSYLVPALDHPALKTMMALHTEFCFFLWTLLVLLC